jgi:hypothetical protein
MLMQCVDSVYDTDIGKHWMVECYMTSDGPRMRVIPCAGMTEDEALEEVRRRNALVAPSRKLDPHRNCRPGRCATAHVRHCPKQV